MSKSAWALIALIYLAFAELLSWTPVSDLSSCLIKPEHGEQTSNHNDNKYCPAFHTGIVASLDALDGFLEHHDKSVVGGFTIVLAISTIGLWLATNKLWVASKNQIDASRSALIIGQRAYLAIVEIVTQGTAPGGLVDQFIAIPVIKNSGATPAVRCVIQTAIQKVTDSVNAPIPTFTKSNLAPQEGVTSIASQVPRHGPGWPIDWDTYEGIVNQSIRVFIWIRLDYRDVFDGTPVRHTECCAEVEAAFTVKRAQKDGASVPNPLRYRFIGPQNSES